MGWTFGSAHSQQQAAPGPIYVETDWSMPISDIRRMRFWFGVTGTSFGDPLAAGNFTMQIDIGSGWQGWKSAKNVTPTRTVGFVQEQGDKIDLDFLGATMPSAGTYPIRLEVEWTGGPYYSNTINVTGVENTWFEGAAPGGEYTEGVAPTGTFTEQAAPTGTFAEVAAPSGGFAESVAPSGGFAEAVAPSGTFAEQAAPSGTFTEDAAPALGTITERAAPTGGFAEQAAPSGSFTESAAPSGSWTEGTS